MVIIIGSSADATHELLSDTNGLISVVLWISKNCTDKGYI